MRLIVKVNHTNPDNIKVKHLVSEQLSVIILSEFGNYLPVDADLLLILFRFHIFSTFLLIKACKGSLELHICAV